MKKIVSSLEGWVGWDSSGGVVTVWGDLNDCSIIAERMMKRVFRDCCNLKWDSSGFAITAGSCDVSELGSHARRKASERATRVKSIRLLRSQHLVFVRPCGR
jgi:hypothetical protein